MPFFGSSSPSSSSSSHSRSPSSSHNSSRKGSMFGRSSADPTILAAREKVAIAEKSERAADNALIQARRSVGEAKKHVRILEREAEEQSRLARAKTAEAKGLGKSAGRLGRH